MSKRRTEEKRAYLHKMETERGYVFDFHRMLAEEDLEFLKRYNALLQSAYLDNKAELNAKTR